MGKYINKIEGVSIGTSFEQKVTELIVRGANTIDPPTEFQENLVCVVDNGYFAAAAWAHNEQEMKLFLRPDGRHKQWLIYKDIEKYID